MGRTNNRIDLTNRDIQRIERPANSDITPGMLIQELSTGNVQPVGTGLVAVNAIQSLTSAGVSSGNFTLSVTSPDGLVTETTGNIAFSATAATLATNVQTALRALAMFQDADVSAAADAGDADILVTFAGAYAATVMADMVVTDVSLDAGTITVATETAGVAAEVAPGSLLRMVALEDIYIGGTVDDVYDTESGTVFPMVECGLFDNGDRFNARTAASTAYAVGDLLKPGLGTSAGLFLVTTVEAEAIAVCEEAQAVTVSSSSLVQARFIN